MVTVDRRTLNRVLEQYRNKVLAKFPNRFFTAAAMSEMETYLKQYQEFLCKTETNPVYQLPIKLLFDQRNCNLDVELDPQADVKII